MAIDENKIVRFPEGAQDVPFEEVNYVMVAGPDGKFKRISKNALKNGLTIENGRIQAVDPGPLPTQPTGQTRYMEVTALGTWTYGGSPIGSNEEGYRTTFFWTGSVWVNNGSVRVKGEAGNVDDIEFRQQTVGATTELTTYTSVAGASFTYGNNTPLPFDGTIDEINYYIHALGDGTITFKVMRLVSGNTYEVVHRFFITNNSSVGVKKIKINEDYSLFYVKKGDILVYDTTPASSRIGFKAVSGKQTIGATTVVSSTDSLNITNGYEIALNLICSSNIVNKKIDSNTEEIDELKQLISDEISIGEKLLNPYTALANAFTTRALLNPFPENGYLTELNIYAPIGTSKFKIFKKNSLNNYDVVDEITINIPTTGVHKLVAGVDFPYKKVYKDGLLGFVIGNQQGIGFASESVVHNYTFGDSDVYGDNLTPTVTTGIGFGIWYKIGTGIEYELRNLEQPSGFSLKKQDVRNLLPSIGSIFNFNFKQSTLPTDWLEIGGWTPTTSGLQSPSVGGWGMYAYHNKFFAIDEDDYNVRVVIKDSQSVFSIARLSTTAQGPSSTVFEIDGNNSVINLYGGYTIGETPTIKYSKDLDLELVDGREYQLSISKVCENYKFIITDLITLESQTIDWLATGNSINIGKSINYPSIIFRSGNILVKNAFLSSKLPREPKVMIIGDSIVDGDTIRNSSGGGADNRFVGLISSALNYNCTIFGRGGETSSNVTSKLPIIDNIIKGGQYAMYEVGINDTSFATWESNMLAFKDIIEAKGMTLVLCTLFPRSGRESFCLQVTNYILGSNYKYVDFAKAMTVGGDRTTRDNSLFLSDQLHPNPQGHKRMFEQVKVDLPELFIL